MKHEIEIPDLPEGWMPVSYRVPRYGENYLGKYGIETARHGNFSDQYLIVVKIQQRRRVLEETEKDNFKYTNGFYANQVLGNGIHIVDQPKIWRVVKEIEK